ASLTDHRRADQAERDSLESERASQRESAGAGRVSESPANARRRHAVTSPSASMIGFGDTDTPTFATRVAPSLARAELRTTGTPTNVLPIPSIVGRAALAWLTRP